MFKIGQQIIFIWNYSSYPGIIRGHKDASVYIVEFPEDSYAGSYERYRDIHKAFLRLSDLENNIIDKKIIIKI
jgi:hypothetical protein